MTRRQAASHVRNSGIGRFGQFYMSAFPRVRALEGILGFTFQCNGYKDTRVIAQDLGATAF